MMRAYNDIFNWILPKVSKRWLGAHELYWEAETLLRLKIKGEAPVSRVAEEEKMVRKVKDYRWPFYKQPRMNRAFKDYFISNKDENVKEYSASNLMFVMGPEKIGKSWFVKYNLKNFERTNTLRKAPMIMHWDLSGRQSLNFDVFVTDFEELLMSSIAEYCKNFKDESLLTNEKIVEVLLERYRPEFIKYYLRRTLNRFICDEDQFVVDDDCKVIMIEVIEEIGLKYVLTQEFIKEKLLKVFGAINGGEEGEDIHSTLRFIKSLLVSVELESRPEAYASMYYRNGVETTDFLLDTVNYMAGYHDRNHYVDAMKDGRLDDDYVHPVLLIEGFDKIMELNSCESRAKDWVDHLLMRLYTDLNRRTHFPVIIESNYSRFFHKQIFEMLKIEDDVTYPTIELYGWDEKDYETTMGHIFNKRQSDAIFDAIGRHLKDWHTVTKLAVESSTNDLSKILALKSEEMNRERHLLRSRLASLYTNELLMDDLDQGLIDFKILQIIEILAYRRHAGALFIGTDFGSSFMENPVIKAMLDAKILYLRRYWSFLQVSRRTHLHFMKEFLREKKSKMSVLTRIRYAWFKLRYSIDHKDMSLRDLHWTSDGFTTDPKFDKHHEITIYHPAHTPSDLYDVKDTVTLDSFPR